MSIINRVPKGWLGLLDAKTQGRTPKEPLGDLSPVIDLTQNYLADIPMEVAQGQSAGPFLGSTFDATITVPAGELWYVYAGSAESFTAVFDQYTYPALAVAAAGGSTIVLLAGPDASPWNATGSTLMAAANWSPPVLYGAGNVFGAFGLRQNAVGAVVARTKILYRKVLV